MYGHTLLHYTMGETCAILDRIHMEK